jgi:small basic protein (TIGR04137 family)
MTLDKSLKVAGGSIKSRNVMTRVERLTRLKELERWKEGDPVLGIPKTRVIKVSLKKKKKVKGADEKEEKKKGKK